MIISNYKILEDKFISKKDRFKLKKSNIDQLKKDFKHSKILIVGAAGSIGSFFVKRFNQFNFNKMVLIDKDENQLTELNRNLLLLFSKKKINKLIFICSDINFLDIKKYIIKNEITHYMNFAAIKHVRSEEHLESVKYMFSTNSDNFLTNKKLIKKNKLKKVFSVSTDKSANPTSFLGVSKKIMEQRLSEFKNNNKKVFVSSVRFANVSFSNGSILKYIVDRINDKKIFGVPDNIYRFFITHTEASSLCLKSLLKSNDNSILIPDKKVLKNLILIKDICSKIINYNGYKPIYVKSPIKNKVKNKYVVLLSKHKTHGQKDFEELFELTERLINIKNDSTVKKIKLENYLKSDLILKKIYLSKNIKNISKIIKYFFPNFDGNKKVKSLSKII